LHGAAHPRLLCQQGRHHADHERVDEVRHWPTPRTARDVQPFLGLWVYLCKHAPQATNAAVRKLQTAATKPPFHRTKKLVAFDVVTVVT
jgi:hypothetical protein